MGVLQNFEKRLENLVEGAFARVFKGVVHPVEIASAMQREADAHKQLLQGGQVLVPNRYIVDLSPGDHDQLAHFAARLAQELAQTQAEIIGEQGWMVYGDVIVEVERGQGLETGMFRIVADVFTGGVEPQPANEPQGEWGGAQGGYGGAPAGYGEQPAGAYGDPAAQPYSGAPAPTSGGYGEPDPYGAPPQQEYGAPISGAPGGAVGGYGVGAPTAPVPGLGPAGFPPPDPYAAPPPHDPYGPPPTHQDPYAAASADPYGAPYAPPPAQNAPMMRLITADGRQFPVAVGVTIIGRGEGAQVRLADVGISRQHARLDFDSARVVLTDLGSTNGTMVNGNRVNAVTLQHGDVIQLGTTTLTFRMDG